MEKEDDVMPTIGEAYVQIIPSAEGISGALSDIMNTEASSAGESASSSFGSSFGSGLKTAMGIGAAAVGTVTAAVGAATVAFGNGVKGLAE